MDLIDIRAYKDLDGLPLLVLVDLQQEYLCQDRPLGLKNAARAVENCRQLIRHAKARKIPIAFVRWAQPGKVFSLGGAFSGWIEGCAPSGSDMVFERAWPSCYASQEFADMMNNGGGRNAVLAGFTGTLACLATIIDGTRLGHRFTFIHDASLSHEIKGKSEAEAHEMATLLISLYARVAETAAWIKMHSGQNMRRSHKVENDHAL